MYCVNKVQLPSRCLNVHFKGIYLFNVLRHRFALTLYQNVIYICVPIGT